MMSIQTFASYQKIGVADIKHDLALHIILVQEHGASSHLFIDWQDVPEFIRQSQARYDEYLLQKENDNGPGDAARSASGSDAGALKPGPPANDAGGGTTSGG